MTLTRPRVHRIHTGVGVLVAILLIGLRSTAAQPASHRGLELSGAVVWSGPSSSVSTDATLTRPAGTPLTLFETSNRLGKGLGAEAHIGFPVTSRLAAEASGTWLRTDLTSRVSGDFEGAEVLTVSQSITEVSVEGAGLWLLRRAGSMQPFVRAGAGWMRQVTTDKVLLQDGLLASAGGGIKYWIATRSRSRFGFRVDGRLVIRSRNLLLGDRRTLAPAFSGGIAIGF